jgi:hypothetical protein
MERPQTHTKGICTSCRARIRELERAIRALSWDDAFGMLTRQGLLHAASVQPRGTRPVIFLDLDGIHTLNQQIGYEEVNRRIHATFQDAGLRHSDIVGRWYSGDEIVIITDGDPQAVIEKLTQAARANGVTFTHASGAWDSGLPIATTISDLAAHVADLKHARKSREAEPLALATA